MTRLLLATYLLLTSSYIFADEFGPFSAEEAQKRFEIHPDCKIELVACEPDVIDPVHIAFNTDGKLWVVEMTDYPNGPADGKPGLSRIRVLSDDDGDGRYTNPVTFAEKLLFANGLMFWKDGVIVTTDGKIQFMRDTDGDGKSDETQIWFQGFATQNPQLRHNHPQLAIDCKIYVANGLRGGNIVPGPDNPWGLDPKSEPLSISGRDFRFDPLTGEYEAIAGMGQFGMYIDAIGNRFVCTNRNPCRQIVLEDEQLKLTPGLRISRYYEDVAAAGEDSKLYPISRTWTTSNLHANQFTAACGVLMYPDFALGPNLYGSIFTCDPTANLVHSTSYDQKGPVYRQRPQTSESEFLATKDEWFRPVNLSLGPGGAMFIVDMYRAVIEHPQFMPVELKNRPDLLLGTDRGRIWKVEKKKRYRTKAKFKADLITTRESELIVQEFTKTFAASGSWKKQHLFRVLLENQDKSVLDAVRATPTDFGFYYLPILEGLNSLSLNDLRLRATQEHLGIKNNLTRIGAEIYENDHEWIKMINDVFVSRVKQMAKESQGSNKYQILERWIGYEAYATLGRVPWAEITVENRLFITRLLIAGLENGDDPYWLSTYLGISARTDSLMVLKDLLTALEESDSTIIHSPVVHDIAELVARQNQEGQVDSVLASLSNNDDLDQVTKIAVLAGITDGYPGGSGALRGRIAKLNTDQQSAAQQLIQTASQKFADKDLAPQLLPLVTSLLGLADDDQTLQQLIAATGSGDATRASLALSALLKRPADQVNPALIELLPKRRGSTRRSILQAMASNVSRAPALLDEIESGRVPALEIDSNMEKMFYRLSDKEVVARAKKLLKREPPADRVKVLAEYQDCLTMKSDPLRGKIVFEKNCATCHKIGDIGVNVAPDISDSRTKQPEYYLTNIIDPNRAIDANYFSFNVLDKEGKVHTGIVAAETSSSVTLKMPEGKMVTIPRDEIELFKNNGVSLMPVGLERTINKQQMADVISFIKNWRYLDGQVPQEVIK